MARVKRGVNTHKRHKRVLKQAKGYYGNQYAYEHRRLRKRDFRKLWIARINAGARQNGLSYSTLIHGLKVAGIDINRKMLSELAVSDAAAFADLCKIAKENA